MLLDDSTLHSRMYTVQLLYDGLYGVAELAGHVKAAAPLHSTAAQLLYDGLYRVAELAGHVEAAAPLQPVHTVQQQAL